MGSLLTVVNGPLLLRVCINIDINLISKLLIMPHNRDISIYACVFGRCILNAGFGLFWRIPEGAQELGLKGAI